MRLGRRGDAGALGTQRCRVAARAAAPDVTSRVGGNAGGDTAERDRGQRHRTGGGEREAAPAGGRAVAVTAADLMDAEAALRGRGAGEQCVVAAGRGVAEGVGVYSEDSVPEASAAESAPAERGAAAV